MTYCGNLAVEANVRPVELLDRLHNIHRFGSPSDIYSAIRAKSLDVAHIICRHFSNPSPFSTWSNGANVCIEEQSWEFFDFFIENCKQSTLKVPKELSKAAQIFKNKKIWYDKTLQT